MLFLGGLLWKAAQRVPHNTARGSIDELEGEMKRRTSDQAGEDFELDALEAQMVAKEQEKQKRQASRKPTDSVEDCELFCVRVPGTCLIQSGPICL